MLPQHKIIAGLALLAISANASALSESDALAAVETVSTALEQCNTSPDENAKYYCASIAELALSLIITDRAQQGGQN